MNTSPLPQENPNLTLSPIPTPHVSPEQIGIQETRSDVDKLLGTPNKITNRPKRPTSKKQESNDVLLVEFLGADAIILRSKKTEALHKLYTLRGVIEFSKEQYLSLNKTHSTEKIEFIADDERLTKLKRAGFNASQIMRLTHSDSYREVYRFCIDEENMGKLRLAKISLSAFSCIANGANWQRKIEVLLDREKMQKFASIGFDAKSIPKLMLGLDWEQLLEFIHKDEVVRFMKENEVSSAMMVEILKNKSWKERYNKINSAVKLEFFLSRGILKSHIFIIVTSKDWKKRIQYLTKYPEKEREFTELGHRRTAFSTIMTKSNWQENIRFFTDKSLIRRAVELGLDFSFFAKISTRSDVKKIFQGILNPDLLDELKSYGIAGKKLCDFFSQENWETVLAKLRKEFKNKGRVSINDLPPKNNAYRFEDSDDAPLIKTLIQSGFTKQSIQSISRAGYAQEKFEFLSKKKTFHLSLIVASRNLK